MFDRVALALQIAVLVLLTGTWLDAAHAGCDNDCRMKYMHYYCGGGPCVQFTYETCFWCEHGLSVACDNTNPPYGSECAPATVNPNTGYWNYAACDVVCACGAVSIVEANNMSGDFTFQGTVTRYQCVPGK
jgi:hypothetical protein